MTARSTCRTLARVVALCAALVLTLSVAACGGDEPPARRDAASRPAAATRGDAGASAAGDGSPGDGGDFMMMGAAETSSARRRRTDGSKTPAAHAGAMVKIAAAKVHAGSAPGTKRRDPSAEMDDVLVEVPAFEIDVLPYPDDPSKAPITDVTWARAAELCRAEGKRLCHELEWELACEGPEGMRYPGGDEYAAQDYEDPVNVVSPLGVRAMGTIAEWTAGEFGGESKGAIAVRGARPDETAPELRRCARRSKVEPTDHAEGRGFRCCRGPAPDLTYDTPTYQAPFQRLDLTHDEFQKMIRSIPQLSRIHDDPEMFDREDLYRFRGKTGLQGSVTEIGALTYKAVQWEPVVGETIVVATGRDGRDAFVVALYKLPDDRYAHAASYILVNMRSPVFLVYTRNPRHIRWLPCYDCNDGGLLTLDDDGLVEISQRW